MYFKPFVNPYTTLRLAHVSLFQIDIPFYLTIDFERNNS